MRACWTLLFPVAIFQLFGKKTRAANLEPRDARRTKAVVDPSFLDSNFAGPQYHHDSSVIPVPIVQEAMAIGQQKIAENFAMDPWELVPRLPDHEVMVGAGLPMGLRAPTMHMDAGGIATGVQDILLDTVGTSIAQTFFGNRNPETDDDDWNDEYDSDDLDDKKDNSNDDDDDDDRDDDRKNLKGLLRARMAPLVLAPSRVRVPTRPAALLHRPIITPKNSVSQTSASRPANGGLSPMRQILIMPQPMHRPMVNHLSSYRSVSAPAAHRPVSGATRTAYIYRPLRVLYDR